VTQERSLGEIAVHALSHGLVFDPTSPGRERLNAAQQRHAGGERFVELSLAPRWPLLVSLEPAEGSEVTLRLDGDAAEIHFADEAYPVTFSDAPAHLSAEARSGVRSDALARTFSNFLLFHPLHLAADGPERRLEICPPDSPDHLPLRFDDVLDVVGAALKEGETDCVAFRWHQRVSAGEVDQALGPLLQVIRRNFDLLIAVECPPPADAQVLDLLYAYGVDAISMPVMGIGQRIEGRPAPLGETIQALERASSVFTRGTVIAPLLIGVEEPMETKRAITRLARMGVRAGFDFHFLRRQWPRLRNTWTHADLRELWTLLAEELEEAKIASPWTPHPRAESTSSPPQAFEPLRPGEPVGGGFWKTKPGHAIARNLIRLRRRLRVRKVEASLESSEL
jgi:hypothetical protein